MLKHIKDEKVFKFILNNLRNEDYIELKDSKCSGWFNQTLENLKTADVTVMFVKDKNGEFLPIAMGGFEPYFQDGNNLAVVWLLSTKFINQYKLIFWKELNTYFSQEKSKYSILFNFIYKSNFQAKRWLRLLGFKFDNPKPEGMEVAENFEFFYKVINRKGK